MKKLYLATIIIISIFIAACGSAGVSNGVSTEVKVAEDKAIPFEVKTAYADMRPDLTKVNFVLGNYDFKVEPKGAFSIDDVSKDDQVRIAIGVRGKKNEDFQNPVQPGEYDTSKVTVDIFHFGDGGQKIVNIRDFEGKLVVSEVTDEAIKGTIDAQKDGKVVRASFTAKKVK